MSIADFADEHAGLPIGIGDDADSNANPESGNLLFLESHEDSASKEDGPEKAGDQSPGSFDVLGAVGSPANAVKSIRKKKSIDLEE
jgi:hypothetical protein